MKSLAVQVEDHPLDYATFEGIIPQGEYGGGTVMVWDQGTWEPEVDPHKGLKQGKLKFRLHGEKLHGSWALVRMGGRAGDGGKNWLLIKHRDDEAKAARQVRRHQTRAAQRAYRTRHGPNRLRCRRRLDEQRQSAQKAKAKAAKKSKSKTPAD